MKHDVRALARLGTLALGVALAAACGEIKNPDADDATADAPVAIDAQAVDAAIDGAGTFTVTVAVGGNGVGTVTSAELDCPGICTTTVAAGDTLTLTATAGGNSQFLGWSGGGCSGGGSCTLTVTSDLSINASFGQGFAIVVTKTGNGAGGVTSDPGGINCGTECDKTYAAGTPVTLTATASVSSTFAGWSGGGCTGSGTCAVTVNTAVAINADFTLRRHTLTTALAGTGGGTITSSPDDGINCGPDCSEVYDHGDDVTLTAAPATGSTFTGWSGGGCTGTGTCAITIAGAATVTATFARNTYPLTVTRAGTGFGTVTSSPGINCGAVCSAVYNHGDVVTLTATATSSPVSQDSTFTGWSGCTGTGSGTCTVTVTAATTVTARFTLDPNVAFVTSTSTTGNMGGLAGADAICQARANAANLPGTYRAWLSSSTTNAATRLGTASGWVRPDGKPFALSRADLYAGKQIYPLRLTETGTDVGTDVSTTWFFSASTVAGMRTGDTCADWTVANGSEFLSGVATDYGDLWTARSGLECNENTRLACFGIDRVAPIAVLPPATGRRAFVSAATFTPSAGLAAADNICASEATAASFAGTFRALLATSGATAASRFNTVGTVVRPDNGVIATAAVLLSNATLWDAAINVQANGTTYLGNSHAWTGATNPASAGTLASTCNNWSAGGTYGSAGVVGSSWVYAAFGSTSFNCATSPQRVYCLQQ